MFLHNGLMEYGSVFGHGAYLGPDFTADYLRRSSDLVREAYGGAGSDTAARRTIEDFRTNRYDERRRRSPQRRAGRRVPRARALLQRLLLRPDDRARPPAGRDHGPDELRQLTAFFAWTAWAAAADGRATTTRTRTTGRPSRASQQADGERDRLVGALADRAARRDRPPVRGRSAAGAGVGWHAREQATLSFRAPATWR